MNITYTPVSYTHLDVYKRQDISDDEGLGRLYADELGTIDIPEHIQNLSLIHI